MHPNSVPSLSHPWRAQQVPLRPAALESPPPTPKPAPLLILECLSCHTRIPRNHRFDRECPNCLGRAFTEVHRILPDTKPRKPYLVPLP